jgi:hypothetical protein
MVFDDAVRRLPHALHQAVSKERKKSKKSSSEKKMVFFFLFFPSPFFFQVARLHARVQ